MSTFQPQTKSELQTAVDAWVSNQSSATATYGAINTWDTSAVTDMSSLFSKSRNSSMSQFNSDISNWNTSSVTNMSSMFRDAFDFNQPLGQWNVSQVTDMNSMFANAVDFNQDISIWDTSKVTNISYMFDNASSMDQPLQYWVTSSVTSNMFMSGYDLTFRNATAMLARGFPVNPTSGDFNQPLPAGSNTSAPDTNTDTAGVQAELQAIDDNDTSASLSDAGNNKKRLAIALAKLT